MSNVKLAIRIRPFSEKEIKSEKEKSPVVCILDENTVTITNLKVSVSGAGDSRERVRRYHADFTFDSSCPPTDPRYASQDKVFEKLGNAVLSAVERRVPACVLAYGQSATGKTHTMMGSEPQPGLVPRLCAALAANHHHITVSFLEIYNERVHDLLAGGAPSPAEDSRDCSSLPRRRGNARKDLRVREHPTRGPYVQNLRRVVVRDCDSLLSVVREGGRRRRTAATRRNPASSRSHALLELATPNSTLYLADLAGSEKASWEGCGGGRQKESANINKSLVALSNVISALVSSGVGRERFVPYRDSSLTWLLKDCFIGGAATFVIATVSPSVTCYGESASTLRWAARARQLPAPQASRNLQQLTRAALQAQLADILATLAVNHIRYVPETKRLIFDKIERVENNDKNICENKMEQKKSINIDVSKSESTPSSVASGSSEKIFSCDKGRIVGEVDNLFGPSLERTRSGSEINIITPLKNKRRQYRSQEVLPVHSQLVKSQLEPNSQISNENINELVIKDGQLENEINNFGTVKIQTHVPLYYDSPRAEIVSSVTERLYSKLKKKEEGAISKTDSLVDRKIMEPLSELRICTNARQRLVDLSSKALKNKRRIGIPAHTQTRPRITRVKDQSTDAQWDLEFYIVKDTNCYKALQNVGTETVPLTPRCKEVAVGSKYGFLNNEEKSVATNTRSISYKNSSTITDSIGKFESGTQTPLVPPPKRKRRIPKHSEIYLNSNDAKSQMKCTPIVSINISQQYNMTPDSTSESDESTEDSKTTLSTVPPDLLTNHSTLDNKADNEDGYNKTPDDKDAAHCNTERQTLSPTEVFPDSDEHNLPRVTPSPGPNNNNFENLILGRNNHVFPLNIAISPPNEIRGSYRKTVKFKDEHPKIAHVGVQAQCNQGLNPQFCGTDSESNPGHSNNVSTGSDQSNQSESDGFVWESGDIKAEVNPKNKCTDNFDYIRSRQYISSNQARYRNSRAKLYRDFLGLEKELSPLKYEDVNKQLCTACESPLEDERDKAVGDFQQKRQNIDTKIKNNSCRKDSLYDIQSDISKSCDRLEAAANKYDSFMVDLGLRRPICSKKLSCRSNFDFAGRTSREYLQHLVQVRRNVIKKGTDFDNLE